MLVVLRVCTAATGVGGSCSGRRGERSGAPGTRMHRRTRGPLFWHPLPLTNAESA